MRSFTTICLCVCLGLCLGLFSAESRTLTTLQRVLQGEQNRESFTLDSLKTLLATIIADPATHPQDIAKLALSAAEVAQLSDPATCTAPEAPSDADLAKILSIFESLKPIVKNDLGKKMLEDAITAYTSDKRVTVEECRSLHTELNTLVHDPTLAPYEGDDESDNPVNFLELASQSVLKNTQTTRIIIWGFDLSLGFGNFVATVWATVWAGFGPCGFTHNGHLLSYDAATFTGYEGAHNAHGVVGGIDYDSHFVARHSAKNDAYLCIRSCTDPTTTKASSFLTHDDARNAFGAYYNIGGHVSTVNAWYSAPFVYPAVVKSGMVTTSLKLPPQGYNARFCSVFPAGAIPVGYAGVNGAIGGNTPVCTDHAPAPIKNRAAKHCACKTSVPSNLQVVIRKNLPGNFCQLLTYYPLP